MPKTTAALLERGLQLVDQLGSGQTAAAEDTEYALSALLSLVAELESRELVSIYIDQTDLQDEGIPDNVFNVLAELLAIDLGPQFRGSQIDQNERDGQIARLIKIMASRPSLETLKALYF